MKDNEIMKALKCCSGETCLGCSLDGEYIGSLECITELSKEALALIQRQQKTIEDMESRIAYYDFDRICHNTVELNVILELNNMAELKKRFRNEFENQMALGLEDCINWADWLDSIADEMWKEAKGETDDR